jgi:hypothetical protein
MFGVNSKMAFRLITVLEVMKLSDSIINGLNPITFGSKVYLVEEKGVLPMV